jgi:hypothetical protein
MNYVEAPDNYDLNTVRETSVFLGGGITNCKDWQKELISKHLSHLVCPFTVFNPRRKTFDINNPKESQIQIVWEHKYLRLSDVLVFYFSEETVCPITLFELGAALERNLHTESPQQIIVYCEPNYIRKSDVDIQTQLINDLDHNAYKYARVHDTYSHFLSDLNMTLHHIAASKQYTQ